MVINLNSRTQIEISETNLATVTNEIDHLGLKHGIKFEGASTLSVEETFMMERCFNRHLKRNEVTYGNSQIIFQIDVHRCPWKQRNCYTCKSCDDIIGVCNCKVYLCILNGIFRVELQGNHAHEMVFDVED